MGEHFEFVKCFNNSDNIEIIIELLFSLFKEIVLLKVILSPLSAQLPETQTSEAIVDNVVDGIDESRAIKESKEETVDV